MSLTDTQIQFAAEFVTLIVAASGIALGILRPPGMLPSAAGKSGAGYRETPVAITIAVVGFSVAGAAAFERGSLLVTGDPDGLLGIARVVSGAALIPLTFVWRSRPKLEAMLAAAALCWMGAGVAEMWPASGLVVDGLLVAGSVTVGVTMVLLSRRSVAAKVATSAATTLLAVVVVLAVALSGVISSSLQRSDLRQLGATARTESSQLGSMVASAVKDARFGAVQLETTFSGARPDPLLTIGSDRPGTVPPAAVAEQVKTPLATLAELYPSGFAYTDPYGNVVASAGQVSSLVAQQLVRDLRVSRLSCLPGSQTGTAEGVFVEQSSAWASAAFPVCESGNGQLLGTVVNGIPLDSAYLHERVRVEAAPTLALVSRGSVIALDGSRPSRAALLATAIAGGSKIVGNSLVSAVPVGVATPSAPLSVLLVAPATNELSTRTQLYRTLFLIALGGTVLALGLSVFVGDRITSGVRRLTRVAARIGRGDTALRSEVRGDDEVADLTAVFNVMLDSVQDQANALQSLADQEARLRNRMEAVVAGMTDALIAVDSSGAVTDFNRAAEELTGVSAASALGRRADEIVSLTADDGSRLGPRLVDPGPARWSRIASLATPDDGKVPVEVSSGAVRGASGELIGNVFLLRDLRHEREVERMKDEFLSRIGHELRTPLTPIKAYADLLLRKQSVPPEQAGAWYGEIRRSSDQLQRIVEMLEFSASSGAGRMLLRFEPLDVRGLVRSLTASWSERIPGNLTIGRRVARDLPMILADKRWITKALEELIGNAVKFSPAGGRIVVSAAAFGGEGDNGSSDRDYIEIGVADHGVGMPREQAALMFGDFVQGDASDTRTFGGLGLGLTLVQRVVEGHGGTVRCESIVGRGTTVVVRLPVPESPPQDDLPKSEVGRTSS